MQKGKKIEERCDGLSCSCGHCHEQEKEIIYDKGKSAFSNFITEYGFEILKIILGLVLFAVGRFINLNPFVKIIIYIISAFIVGYNVIIGLFKGVIYGDFLNENALMLIASVSAFVLGEYSEGSLIIILFVSGELLENIATGNSRRKIAGLSSLKSEIVHLITAKGIVEVEPEKVKIGSLLQVKRGEKVPIDGVLLDRTASIDVRAITGESKIFDATTYDKIYSGSINVGDPIVIRTEKEYKDSTTQKIIETVENCAKNKAKSQKFITSFAKIYTPVIVAIGFMVALIPPFFDGLNFAKWVYKALSFIVISCPCALVISVPLAYFIGIGSLAKKGVLVKGGEYLENLSKIETIAFDKTGTLTNGKFVVTDVKVFGCYEMETIKSYAFALESCSNHPISKAICSDFSGCKKITADSVSEILGKGVKGVIEGNAVFIGNKSFMLENGVQVEEDGGVYTTLYLAISNTVVAKIYLSDTVKNGAQSVLEQLKKLNVKDFAILSGDKKEIAYDLGEQLGVSKVYGELLPQQKLEKLKEIKNQTDGNLAYVGDGINDAPVLSFADVGVGMGGLGSDIAVETSDVVIMDDDIGKIPLSIRHARKVKNIVLQNVVGSIGIKISIMALSLIIGVPVWIAMFADVGVMLIALLNSFRSYLIK